MVAGFMLLIIVPLMLVMLGLYYITLAIWELRAGIDRTRYVKLMFGGLVLVVIAPLLFIIYWYIGILNLKFI
ncbi:hypothetical protein QPK24_14370 [Paenibacillus polygoni]|uniref:Uncharacterized protein n=1 Tax=Paenibacillus polygoni TaxID=3050112 RepID=A0ABY8WZ33_9BACL|nr:hypothetical protein [Paenibacillus polygoni]WIV17609.1 hypothetical protein QPK24_14370 [Paenibacillus polygoni]